MISSLFSYLTDLHPIVFHSLVILASLVIVAKSADMVVYSISEYSRKLGVSDYLIGFLVVSIGTALPELVASLTGTLVGQGAIVFGTVLGSNLFKLPLLGIILLIAKNIRINQSIGKSASISIFIITSLPVLLVIDGVLSKFDGLILIIAFFIYVWQLWRGENQLGKMKKRIEFRHIWKDSLIFGLALAALLLSARWLVFSSVHISDMLNISPYVVGLIVIGVGASAPELTVQIRSIFKRHQDIAFGNVLGSLVANSAFVLGTVALIKPVVINSSTLIVTSVFMIVGTLYTLRIMSKGEVNWKHGSVLILFYALFLFAEWVF